MLKLVVRHLVQVRAAREGRIVQCKPVVFQMVNLLMSQEEDSDPRLEFSIPIHESEAGTAQTLRCVLPFEDVGHICWSRHTGTS